MKKIAIVSYGGLPLPPVKGGAVENLIHFLVLNNEFEKKIELTVFSLYDKNAEYESHKYKNTNFVYIKSHGIADAITGFTNRVFRKLRFSSGFQMFPYLIDIVKIIKKSDFDCVIVENKADYTPYLSKKVKIPVILHMHNDYLNNKYYLANEVINSCNQIISVSDYVKKCILTIKNDAKNVCVLRNVIDVEKFMSVGVDVRNCLRESYKIKDSDVVFAFLGRVTPSKGIAELIEAFSIVAEKYSNVKLLVVGAEWFSGSVNSAYINNLKSNSINIKDKIIFTGYVDYSVISEQYACVDVVVVPSIIGEAAPLVVLEAMAAGKALIVSDSGGISEYIDSECAIEVSRVENFVKGLADAMETLLINERLRKNMGQHGRLRAKLYDKDNYLKNMLDLIDN